MTTVIFVLCLLNLSAGAYLVITSQTLSQGMYGGICLIVSSLFFIGGAIIFKIDRLISEVKNK